MQSKFNVKIIKAIGNKVPLKKATAIALTIEAKASRIAPNKSEVSRIGTKKSMDSKLFLYPQNFK